MKRAITFTLAILFAALCCMAFTDSTPVNASPADSGKIMVAQAGAILEAEDIVIRKKEEMNFRVRVKNSGIEAARNLSNNLTVILSVKDEASGKWVVLKEWQNIDKIVTGQTVSRDYFTNGKDNPNLQKDSFTLKAEIKLKKPNGITISKKSVERSYPEDAVNNP